MKTIIVTAFVVLFGLVGYVAADGAFPHTAHAAQR